MDIKEHPDLKKLFEDEKTCEKPEHKKAPYRRYKEQWRNDIIQWIHNQRLEDGWYEAIEQIERFRMENIELLESLPFYPFKDLKPGQKGILLHPDFIELLPKNKPIKEKIKVGFKLISVRKIPLLTLEKNFRIIR